MGDQEIAQRLLYCSFCGKSSEDESVELMVAAEGGVNICSDCIELCSEMLADHREENQGVQS